ncbi:MAG: efflux RND transporter periplasmic adaptor subunit [Egibacteraceae bacterium]
MCPLPSVRLRRAGRRALLLALAVVATGCVGDDLPAVEVEQVASGEVQQTVAAPATVEATARQDVAAGVSGVVVSLRVQDGERVRRGQTVLRLSSQQVDLARDQAEAAEAAAGAAAVDIPGDGNATIAETQDAVDRLEARTQPRIVKARKRAKAVDDRQQRTAALAAVDAVEASYELTRTSLLASGQALAAQQRAAADALESALNQAVDSATAAQRLQAQAAAQAAAEQGDNLVVKAPFSGVVQLGEAAVAGGPSLPSGTPGEVASELAGVAGQLGGQGGGGGSTLRIGAPVDLGQTLFSVFDLSERYVAANVDEVDAPQVREGQSVTILVDAFPDATFTGVVERIQITADRTEAGGVGYPVRIRVLGPGEGGGVRPRRLRVGMTASAEIATKQQRSDRVVPSRALLRREAGDVVYVVRDGGIAVVPVRVQALGEEQAAVRGQLRPGDDVVVAGYEDLSDGDEVRVE